MFMWGSGERRSKVGSAMGQAGQGGTRKAQNPIYSFAEYRNRGYPIVKRAYFGYITHERAMAGNHDSVCY